MISFVRYFNYWRKKKYFPKYFPYLPTHRSNCWVGKGKQTIFQFRPHIGLKSTFEDKIFRRSCLTWFVYEMSYRVSNLSMVSISANVRGLQWPLLVTFCTDSQFNQLSNTSIHLIGTFKCTWRCLLYIERSVFHTLLMVCAHRVKFKKSLPLNMLNTLQMYVYVKSSKFGACIALNMVVVWL
jgi:hypothetical protein